MDEPLVSVGIPCYNRPEGLRRTLECITGQTYTNLEIIVSDNCSPNPEVERVGREFAEKDPRVKYVRQSDNLGALPNFHYVLRTANGKYFMWGSDDDEWSPNFIEATYSCLEKNPDSNMAFTNIVSVDTFGNTIRNYPGWLRFTKEKKFKLLIRFVFEPEILGKANLMYSLFERNFCINVWNCFFDDRDFTWGADNGFVLCALMQTHFSSVEDILLLKRLLRSDDSVDIVRPLKIIPFFGVFPFLESLDYTCTIVRACKQTPYWPLVFICMIFRIPHSLMVSMAKTILCTLKIYNPIEADNAGK